MTTKTGINFKEAGFRWVRLLASQAFWSDSDIRICKGERRMLTPQSCLLIFMSVWVGEWVREPPNSKDRKENYNSGIKAIPKRAENMFR